MLLAQDNGILSLFGNWLRNRDASFYRLRAKGGFLVSASYNGKKGAVESAEIFSEQGGTIAIELPWKHMQVRDDAGRQVEITEFPIPNWSSKIAVSFKTEAGRRYILGRE